MGKIWTIATNAFTETVRQPIFTVLLLVTFGVLVFDVPLAAYGMDTDLNRGDNRMLVDLGLSTLMMSGLFIASFSASRVLAREIERKTVLTVVSKPVPRTIILAGKFLGVAMAVTVAFYVLSLVFLMTVRHGVLSRAGDTHDMVVISFGVGAFVLAVGVAMFCNYFFGWSFTGTNVAAGTILFSVAMALLCFVGRDWTASPFAEWIDPQVLAVLLLLWMAVLVMTALAVAVSTRLAQGATLGVCVGIFLLSLLTESLLKPHAGENLLARLAYRLVPNLTYFFALDALTLEQPITGRYIALAAAYGACFVTAALLLGMAMFQTREMDSRSAAPVAPGMVNVYAWFMRFVALAAGLIGLGLLAGSLDATAAIFAATLVPAGVGLWLLAGFLGRGVRRAMIVVMSLAAVQLTLSFVMLGLLYPHAQDPLHRTVTLTTSIAHALYVLIMYLRPATRAHFAKPATSSAVSLSST